MTLQQDAFGPVTELRPEAPSGGLPRGSDTRMAGMLVEKVERLSLFWRIPLAHGLGEDEHRPPRSPVPSFPSELAHMRIPAPRHANPLRALAALFLKCDSRLHASICTLLLCAALMAPAGALAQATGCDSLAGQPVTPRVDYYTQIQPIWEIRCSNCHVNFGGSPSAGLSLNAEDAWLALVAMPSVLVPEQLLVAPGDVSTSFLFEKLNCEAPVAGLRMPRGRLPLPAAEQALIRDWIRQGAREFAVLFENGFEPVAVPPQAEQ
jgi:hypothetical protein